MGVVQYGDFTEWHNNRMTLYTRSTPNDHILHKLAAYSNAPCTSFVEIGLVRNYRNQYGWFYGVLNKATGQAQDVLFKTTTPNGSTHSYEILYAGNRAYGLYLDFSHVASYSTLGYGTCRASAGLEFYYNSLTHSHSDTFTLTPLQWESTNLVWHYDWTTSMYWHDVPCCTNGTYYGANWWADNKA